MAEIGVFGEGGLGWMRGVVAVQRAVGSCGVVWSALAGASVTEVEVGHCE